MDQFIEESIECIDSWKLLNDEIVQKEKQINEAKTALDVLEVHFGSNDHIKEIHNTINKQNKDLESEIIKLKTKEAEIQNIKTQCKQILSDIFRLYTKINQEYNMKTPEETSIEEPIAVEVGRILYSNLVDNQQLRNDPSIYGIFKDVYRKEKSDEKTE